MRKANLKVNLSYYIGYRVGISDAINAFHQQNGYEPHAFNQASSMRKEYERALNFEAEARRMLL